tara:strand:- start:1187 stop:1711 length:525 start_codon:yes stop_codon:yes gene_type:complete
MTTTIITDAAKIDTLVADLKTRGASWQRDAHIAAMSIGQFTALNGDWSKVAALADAFPKSINRQKLADWFNANVNGLKMSVKQGIKVEWDKDIPFTDRAFDQANGDATPFWDMTNKPAAEATLATVLASFEKALGKLEKNGGIDLGTAQSMLTAVKNLVPVTNGQLATEISKAA